MAAIDIDRNASKGGGVTGAPTPQRPDEKPQPGPAGPRPPYPVDRPPEPPGSEPDYIPATPNNPPGRM